MFQQESDLYIMYLYSKTEKMEEKIIWPSYMM